MVLPKRDECILWLKEFKMPDNIFAHVMQVNRISNYLAETLIEKGVEVDVRLVDRASIIHDIDKHLTLKSGKHGYKGQEILKEKGYPKLGEFCVTHLLTYILDHNFPSIEHKIVFYADKRAIGDKIVSINERFDYFTKRYGSKSNDAMERILKTKKPTKELEKELFEPLDISPKLSELNEQTN